LCINFEINQGYTKTHGQPIIKNSVHKFSKLDSNLNVSYPQQIKYTGIFAIQQKQIHNLKKNTL